MSTVRRFTSSVLGPRERGIEFGERHPQEIARTVASYLRLFSVVATHPFDVDTWAGRAWQVITELDPGAAEEIGGIAEGAGQPVQLIAALNARTELLAVANPLGADECSTVVALPPGRPPVAVQTWDWYAAMSDNWLHWTIPHPDGTLVETVTEYGVLGKIGVSSHGIGVLFNMLHHANDAGSDIGFPLHLLSRQILDHAHTLEEAIVLATSVSPSASSSLTVVEGRPEAGHAVSIEMFPGGPGLLEPEDDLLVRTNHFVSKEGHDGCMAQAVGPGSEIRRDKLLTSFGEHHPTGTEEVLEAMRDHAEVGGVCAHPDRSLDPTLWHATLATVAIDTRRGRLDVRPGGPCGHVGPC
jgi:isopenicillin-N N-acyltransferase-like protein